MVANVSTASQYDLLRGHFTPLLLLLLPKPLQLKLLLSASALVG